MVIKKEGITFNLDEGELRFCNSMLNILDRCVTSEGVDQQLYGELIINYYNKNN
tara:strand:+ start:838 stop:999 length:162 start_codon:yes stop_codon:yes gene_type:complete